MKSKAANLIVVMAWDADDEGNLHVAFQGEQVSADRAVRVAETLARKHTAVLAWSREANPHLGEYGAPTELFRHGPVPDME